MVLMTVWPVVFSIILLHAPDGREIDINPAEITSLRETMPDDYDDKLLAKHIRCMVSMTDGKFANVVETCVMVREAITTEIKRLQATEQREYQNKGYEP